MALKRATYTPPSTRVCIATTSTSRRAWRSWMASCDRAGVVTVTQALRVSAAETGASADLGGSSKYCKATLQD